MVDPIPLHIAITYQPHINTNTMDSNMPSNTTTDGYDEASDTYPTPTDAQTLAWVVREVKDLRRMLLAHSFPYGRATGGAIDIDTPGAHAMRWAPRGK